MQGVPVITRLWEALKARRPQGDQGSSPIGAVLALTLLLAAVYVTGALLLSQFSADIVMATLGVGALIVLLTLGLARR
uniref:hypothetical protein n=1 Tax=Streptomyces cellulosae TaxID=1968 RepID=UPI002F9161C1